MTISKKTLKKSEPPKLKKTNNTKKRKQYAKNRPPLIHVFSYKSGCIKNFTKDELLDLGRTFVQWAYDQQFEKRPYTTLEDFYGLNGISKSRFNELCLDMPELAEYREQAKMHLASLRENGVNRREFCPSMIARNQHQYNSDWIAVDKYWNDLKKEVSKAAAKAVAEGTTFVTLDELKCKKKLEDDIETP